MNTIRHSKFAVILTLLAVLLAPLSIGSGAPPVAPSSANDPILQWNAIALQAVADDHSGTFGTPDQGGPTRTARALAVVHIAMYDAVNAIVGGYEPYLQVTGLPAGTIGKASVEAAVAQAAHDTLAEMYPKQVAVFDRALQRVLNGVPVSQGRNEGKLVGAKAAQNILADREDDGSDTPNQPFGPSEEKVIGLHQPDPLNPGQGLLTPLWGDVVPFAMDNVTNFHAPPPPQPDSADPVERMNYAVAFDDVRRLGGDGVTTPTERTAEQTEIGLFWAYDGTNGLGTPPRLYNQIARCIAQQKKNTVAENARLFALLNIAQADAGIACWYTKYAYNFWRPVIGVRCGEMDDNEFTIGDANWTPLGAPATNQSNGGSNFTPPFPSYTSGHATFGAASFRTFANLYGDDCKFRLISDEMNGHNTDANGNHRATVVRSYTSFSQASRENARSRIYLGIHWQFDADEGIAIGDQIADYAFDNFLQPLP